MAKYRHNLVGSFSNEECVVKDRRLQERRKRRGFILALETSFINSQGCVSVLGRPPMRAV